MLNEGLHLAMERGTEWLKPVQARLSASHPALTQVELEELNATCQAVMRHGHALVHALALTSGSATRREDFEPLLTARYPWVSSQNLTRLFDQGMYYAWKDLRFA